MSNKLSTLARVAGDVLTEGPRTFGKSIGAAIRSPFEKRRIEKDNQTDSTIEEVLLRRAQQSGNYEPLQRFLEQSAQRQMGEANTLQQAQKDAISGGAKTALSIAAAGPVNRSLEMGRLAGSSIPALVRLGAGSSLGATLGGGMSYMAGQDPLEGAVRGAAESVKTTGLTNTTAPFFNPIIRSLANNPVSEGVGKAVAGGLTNLAEDEAFTRLTEMRSPTTNERLFSTIMGALTAQAPLNKKDEALDIQTKEWFRDWNGRFKEQKNQLDDTFKGKLPSEVDDLIQMRADKSELIKIGDRKYKFKSPDEAAGFIAGIEFKTDEEGKINGVQFNPAKALIGVAGVSLAGFGNKREDINGPIQSPFTRATKGKYAIQGRNPVQMGSTIDQPQSMMTTTEFDLQRQAQSAQPQPIPAQPVTMDQQIRANQAATGQQVVADIDTAIQTKDLVRTQQLVDYLRSLPEGNPLKAYIQPSISIANRVGMQIN